MRASPSLFLSAGNSLPGRARARFDHLPARDLEAGLVFLACAATGSCGRVARFRRFLDAGRIRLTVLVTAAASAIVLIAHSLVG